MPSIADRQELSALGEIIDYWIELVIDEKPILVLTDRPNDHAIKRTAIVYLYSFSQQSTFLENFSLVCESVVADFETKPH